ncbi:MAG: nucleotidyl transferase AbiEii/AbiGii toxin family protein [Longimicrobiales bacterium]
MDSRPAPDFERFIANVARDLTARDLPFMLIGGQAVLLHGEPRLTLDIDITLGVDPGRLDDVMDTCAALGLLPLPSEPDRFVRSTFVLPAADSTGLRVDFIFSSTPYERQAIERAQHVEVGGVAVPFASAEDLILHKLFAGRARDLEDAAGIVRRKGESLDWTYMERWAEQFSAIEGRESLVHQLRELRQRT